jgi:subtilisin family serine protease
MWTLKDGELTWTWDVSDDGAVFAGGGDDLAVVGAASPLSAVFTDVTTSSPDSPTITPAGGVVPTPSPGITEVQLDGYTYGPTTTYGSDIQAAWVYSTGLGTSIALIDDGFDPATTLTYGDFANLLSRNFSSGNTKNIGEPSGGYHGTTTSGLIGESGSNGLPVGLAPNALIIGAKVAFGSGPFSEFVQALQYTSVVADVINNSWAFSGYAAGEPTNRGYTTWYSALSNAVRAGRSGLGDVVVFAAGNDRADANTVALQPINSNPMVIAVAASDADGLVASYSNPGPGLLVAAIGDNVAVPLPGATSYGFGSGTSYAAPTVSAITSLMLSVNPLLGWRDVQEILADAAYAPPPSAAGFVTNGATTWNGGGMQYSEDLGFGVIDANVAVNLARAWTEQSTSANLDEPVATHGGWFTVSPGGSTSSTLAVTQNVRIQQVELSITDQSLLAAYTELVLISPDGTQSVVLNDAGLVGGTDKTGGLDLSGSVMTDNAFWGEDSTGTWTLEAVNSGSAIATVTNWNLTFWGDNAATVATPLVYTPEFAGLAVTDPARTVVAPTDGNTTTIDLIALPDTTSVNLNGGAGLIDGVVVTVQPGLSNANADGSTGSVTLVGLTTGGSELSGGDGPTTITGYGNDTIRGGLGATTIATDAGGSTVTLSSLAAASTQDTIASGGGDTIWAGSATVAITDTGTRGDMVYAQDATLSFVNGSGASVVYAGTGTVTIQAGAGGGVYYAATGGGSLLTAGIGKVVFYGGANGDVLIAAGSANDVLVAGGGSETLLGGTNTGNLSLLGGSGSDIMVAGAGRTGFTVGTGNDTLTDGGIADMITVIKGHAGGLDVIDNFRVGTDQLILSGFSPAAAANVIAGQVSDGSGGSLLFLPDGTRIDLAGLAHATSAVFT